MNITRKGLFTLVSILAVCIFLSALAQQTPFNGGFIQDILILELEQNTLPDGLGYLADDLYNLPEIQDGVSQKELEAAERVADLMISLDPEVQQGLHLIPEFYRL